MSSSKILTTEIAAEKEPSITAEGFVDVREAADHLGISRAKLYQLLDAGEIRYAKIGRSRRIPRRALREFAERAMIG